jgi:hypothetical protein
MVDQSPQKPLTVLEGFKGFLLWVGGSLAGITAVLYACGYLVTRAQLSMLGLYGLVEYGNEHFLQEGSKFLLAASYSVARTLLPIAAGVVILAAVWMLLRFAVAAARRSRRLVHAWSWISASRPGRRLAAMGSWLKADGSTQRRLFFGLLFVALLWHGDIYLVAFERPLSVANVLYADPVTASSAKPGTGAEIKHWILSDAREKLAQSFEELLFGALFAAILALLAWRTVRAWPARAWLAAPFFAALLLYLVMLPMTYGVLQRQVRYPVILLAAKADVGAPKGTIFLLALTDRAFVVWDGGAKKVVWIPVESVKRAEIRAVENLFQREQQTKGDAK